MSAKNQQRCLNLPRDIQVSQFFFQKPPTPYRYWETIVAFKWQKQGSLSSFRPLTERDQHKIVWKFPREQLKERPTNDTTANPPLFSLVNTFKWTELHKIEEAEKASWEETNIWFGKKDK